MVVHKPRTIDVLCGRGKTCFEHRGNDNFRNIIARHIDIYSKASTKKAKMQVVVGVVEMIIAGGGRFLVRKHSYDGDKSQSYWVDGGRKQGKKKVGHALRDALRGRVKCISKLRVENNLTNKKVLMNTIPNQSMNSKAYSAPAAEEDSSNSDSLSLDSQDTNDEFFIECLGSLESDDPFLPELEVDETASFSFALEAVLEPEKEWRKSKLESDMAHDLLAFFNGEQRSMITAY